MARYIYILVLTVFNQLLAPVVWGDVEEHVGNDVDEVKPANFDDYIKKNKYLLVLFYEKDCITCVEAKTVFDTLVDPEIFPGAIKKIRIADENLATSYGAEMLPSIVLFRGGNPVVFDGDKLSAEGIDTWLTSAHEVATQELTDGNFEHLTQASTGATTGDWLVAFYEEPCSSILPILESFGVRIKRKMNVATVLMSTNPRLVKRMKATKCPSLIFYRQGKMYRYEVEKYDTQSLTSFVAGWYKNMKGETIPVDPSAFDELTDNIAKALKDQVEGPNRTTFLVIAGGITAIFVLVLVVACVISRKAAEKKKKLF